MVQIKFGDVIYVQRDCGIFGYKHFGVYSGSRNVIHYTKEGSEPFNGVIRETSLTKFLDGDSDCYICSFDKRGRQRSSKSALLPAGILGTAALNISPTLFLLDILPAMKEIYDLLFGEQAKLFSAAETVKRARSRIGEHGYNLLLNNCEHFAVWCKTGVEKSEQVEEIIRLVTHTGRNY